MITLGEKFIQTTDKVTADKLISAGVQLVCKNNSNQYIFITPDIITFDKNGIDQSKITYSNILTF